MSCSLCNQNLTIGNIYHLTGNFACEGCNNKSKLNPNAATYLGLTIDFKHHFQLISPHVCPYCNTNPQIFANIPCGDIELTDILFQKVKHPEPIL